MVRRYLAVFGYALLAGMLTVGGSGPAFAQASQQGADPGYVDNRSKPQAPGPFTHEWSKPGGTTGGYIYNDPRLRSPYRTHPKRGRARCPAPLIFDPRTGACR